MITGIVWTKEYELGVEEIDVQHKHLVDLVNLSIKKGNGLLHNVQTDDLLAELDRYTRWHFSCEESLMQMYSFPKFQLHLEEHETLLKELSGKSKAVISGGDGLITLNEFLFSWYGGHAFGYDQELAEFIKDVWKI